MMKREYEAPAERDVVQLGKSLALPCICLNAVQVRGGLPVPVPVRRLNQLAAPGGERKDVGVIEDYFFLFCCWVGTSAFIAAIVSRPILAIAQEWPA